VVLNILFASFSRGDKEASLREGKLHMHHQAVFILSKNTHSNCSYEFIPTKQISMKEASRCLAAPK